MGKPAVASEAGLIDTTGAGGPVTLGQPPLDRIRGFVQRIGPARLVPLGALLLAFLGFTGFLGWKLTAPDYALLFTGLQPADAQVITDRLQGLRVPYRLTPDGSAVMVPQSEVLRLRMQMAQDGLPNSGTVGYEIFDDRSTLGTSQFEANVNLLRALEGELSRTIASMDAVRSARVHLVQPKRELFQRTAAPASASVIVKLNRRDGLGAEQIAAIRHLVAGAVPWLQARQVTVVDDQGQLLAQEDDDERLVPGRTEAFQRAFEDRLNERLRSLLERSLGAGRVHVTVSADLDFDQVTITSEEYDPNSQVARSTQTIEEESELVDRETPAVTVQNNLPLPDQIGDAPAASSSERTVRTEETVNFEISRTVRNHIQQGGRVRRLSIAVLVDGGSTTNAAGEVVYAPRSADELAAIEALVASAAGVDLARGDVVRVINRPFAKPDALPEFEESTIDVVRTLWGEFGQAITMLLATLLMVFFVGRPLLQRAFPSEAKPALTTQSGLTVTDEGQVLIEPGSAAALAVETERTEEMLQINQIRGQIRASLLGRVTDLIDEHPEEAVRVLRNWLLTAE
ncbi:MAG: flagellar M-ring protein FliF [Geminicoccaceae bacterium]|nr:MAG: flagellar M-ring protein FliF [Geminicoccaceae bacterium]